MEGEGTRVDRWGYPVRTTSDDCISVINSYYQQVLGYGRKRTIILQAPQRDENCVLANTLAACTLSSSKPSSAASHLAAARSRLGDATAYERVVFDAVASLMNEERDDLVAFELHSKLLKEFPRDLVSLKRAQMLCFYMGRPDLSLHLVEQVLPQNQDESYIYGMLAFPLLELGRMDEAEKAAKKGLEINKDDIWAQHNLCHVFQNDCRFREAVEFMEAYSSSWGSCSSFMYTHNWWHIAICYLEGHSALSRVLEVYDHHIWKELERNDAEPGEVYLNALGLLLRAYVRGKMADIEGHLKTLVDCLTDKSFWHVEWLLDILALWALACGGEVQKADDLLKSMKSRLHGMGQKKQMLMQTAIKLAEALYAYGRGNCSQVYQLLGPDFDAINCKMIGASDEQLDVFDEVWLSVLLETRHITEAIEKIKKKIEKRGNAPFLWRLLERGYLMAGSEASSLAAKERAMTLETVHFESSA